MKGRVLIVDYNVEIRDLLVDILDRVGYEVSTAADGIEALQDFELTQPNLIITELRMPNMDGYEIVRRVRETSGVPIVVITADTEEMSKAFDAGADAFLVKTFDVPELLAQVDALVTGSKRYAARQR